MRSSVDWGSAATDHTLWTAFTRLMADVDAPKRPMSSYMCFHQEQRARMIEENPTLSFSNLGKLAADEWHKLTAEERVHFVDLAKQAKATYVDERKVFVEAEGAAAAAACREIEDTWTKDVDGAGSVQVPTFVRLRERLEQLRHHHSASKKRRRSSDSPGGANSSSRGGSGRSSSGGGGRRSRPPTLHPAEASAFLAKRGLDVKDVAVQIESTTASLRLWLAASLRSVKLCNEVQLKLEAFIREWLRFEKWVVVCCVLYNSLSLSLAHCYVHSCESATREQLLFDSLPSPSHVVLFIF